MVTLEYKRACAHRFLVDVRRFAFFQQFFGVLGRLHRGKAHGQVLNERGIDPVERELDGLVVDFLHLGDVFIHAHVGEVREFGRVSLAERHVLVEHAGEGEDHVVCIEFAGGLEVRGGVELDPVTQMEGVGQVVGGNVPARGEAGFNLGAAAFELAQTVVDGLGRGIEVGPGGVLARVKTGWTAFRAKHQIGRCLSERCTCQQAGAH